MSRRRTRRRIYDAMLEAHLEKYRQMVFVSGPRQVGKTTTCRSHASAYANWDNTDDRTLILSGPARLAERLIPSKLAGSLPVALFDELHKHPRWKQLLKGFFDTYGEQLRVIVTGSSRLDTYRRVGDSLMGRYFPYRMHPFTVAETLHQDLPDSKRLVRPPAKPRQTEFDALWQHGGYPEPFLNREREFTLRWQDLRQQQLLREDIRSLTQV